MMLTYAKRTMHNLGQCYEKDRRELNQCIKGFFCCICISVISLHLYNFLVNGPVLLSTSVLFGQF